MCAPATLQELAVSYVAMAMEDVLPNNACQLLY